MSLTAYPVSSAMDTWVKAGDPTQPATAIAAAAVAGHVAVADPHTAYLKADGSRALTGNQSAGSHKITNLAAGVSATDAANVGQVPALIPGPTSGIFTNLTSQTWAGGTQLVFILLVGGGGGGGGGSTSPSNQNGGGGSSGAISLKPFILMNGDVITVTAGSAGIGGTSGASPTAGGNGGTSLLTVVRNSSTVLSMQSTGGVGGGAAGGGLAGVGGGAAGCVTGQNSMTGNTAFNANGGIVPFYNSNYGSGGRAGFFNSSGTNGGVGGAQYC